MKNDRMNNENENNSRRLQLRTDIRYNMIKKCPNCGSGMKYIYGEMFECPDCGQKELSDFGKVREYLDKNGPQPAIAISQHTGVSLDEINKYLKEGRVEIPDGSSSYIHCQACGADIRYGRFCPECMIKLTKQLSGAIDLSQMGEKPKHKPHQEGSMHFLDSEKIKHRGRK